MTPTAPFARPEPGVSGQPLAQVWHRLAARWAEHLNDVRQAREAEALTQLSVDTLRDIGAPESWVARAAHRREIEQQRLRELRQWRAG
ncbi:MAG: hypothetical protein KF891_13915 [Rhizobacter sp.]|nr:hypothetical protein [Rhizobacter sp.]